MGPVGRLGVGSDSFSFSFILFFIKHRASSVFSRKKKPNEHQEDAFGPFVDLIDYGARAGRGLDYIKTWDSFSKSDSYYASVSRRCYYC